MTQEVFEEEDIPIAEFENIGLSKDGRIDLGEHDLKALLAGMRTDTLRLHNLTDGDIKILHLDAKLSLHRNEQGNLDLLIHPVYRRPKAPEYLTDDEVEKLASGETVNVRPVSWENTEVAGGPYEFNKSWYDPTKHYANFVILIEPPLPIDPIALWEVKASFGKPAHIYTFGRYTIMVFNKNLLADLVPSLPPPPPS